MALLAFFCSVALDQDRPEKNQGETQRQYEARCYPIEAPTKAYSETNAAYRYRDRS